MAIEENKNDYIEINFAHLIKDLLEKLLKLFLWVWKGLVYIFLLLIKYWILTIFIILIIAGIFIKDTMIKSEYTSSFLIRSNAAEQQYLMDQINKIGSLITSNSYAEVSKTLNLDKKQAKEIKDLRAFWRIDIDGDSIADYVDYQNKFIKKEGDTLSQRLKDGFIVRIIYSENFTKESLNKLQENIIYYLSNIKYIQKQKAIKLYTLDLLSQELKNQHKKVDSIAKQLYNFLFKDYIPKMASNQIVFLNDKTSNFNRNELSFYKDQLYLYRKYVKTIAEKEKNTEAVSLVLPPLYRESKYIPKANIWKFALWLFIIEIILLIIIDNRKKIKNLIQ